MKFVRKLLLGMAVFVILILIEVQATDINSTTFHHSLILIPLHHSSKLDRVNHHFHDCIKGPLSTCQKKKKKKHGKQFGSCVVRVFDNCVNKQLNEDDLNYGAAKKYHRTCEKRNQEAKKISSYL